MKVTAKGSMTVQEMRQWQQGIIDELRNESYVGKYIRVEEENRAFNADYVLCWCEIAKQCPSVTFYTFTRQTKVYKTLHKLKMIPKNFTIIYTFGGLDDNLINEASDRHCKVFLDTYTMKKSEYVDTSEDETLAVTSLNNYIGILKQQAHTIFQKHTPTAISRWKANYMQNESK